MKTTGERRYTLTVTEHQLALISRCIEDCHRFAAGQTDLWNTLSSFLHGDDLHAAREQMRKMQPYITGGKEYSWDGNGCPNPAQRKFIAETCCLYREMLHRLTVITRKDGDGYSVYQNPTLPAVRMERVLE